MPNQIWRDVQRGSIDAHSTPGGKHDRTDPGRAGRLTEPIVTPGWRFLNSLWLIVPIGGLGIFSFLDFLYCAIRVRNAKWWITAAVSRSRSRLLGSGR